MTLKQQQLTVIAVAIIAITIVLISFGVYTCQAEEPLPQAGDLIPIDGQPNGMVYYSPIPLTTKRFIAYGRVVTDRSGVKTPDLGAETSVVQAGRGVREKLLLVRDPKGFFALQVVMIQHSTITLVKEPAVPWDLLLPEIETILSTLEK